MQCEVFEDRLHDLLDQRIDPESDEMILQHAESCCRCDTVLRAFSCVSDGLDAWDIPSLDDNFACQVVAQLPQSRAPRWRRWHSVVSFSALAAGLLFAISFAFQGDTQPPNGRKSVAFVQPNGLALSGTPQVSNQKVKPVSQNEESRLAAAQLRGLIDRFAAIEIDYEQLEPPVDRITGGLKPIQTSFTVVIDALRNTLPIGRDERRKDDKDDSASVIQFRPFV